MTDNVMNLRDQDIRKGARLATEYDNARRKNMCILYSIGMLLSLAFVYVCYSKYNKVMS